MVTFALFPLPVIIFFVFLIFTLNPFDSNAFFQVSSLPLRTKCVSLPDSKSSPQTSSSKHLDLVSLDMISSAMMNNKGFNTES